MAHFSLAIKIRNVDNTIIQSGCCPPSSSYFCTIFMVGFPGVEPSGQSSFGCSIAYLAALSFLRVSPMLLPILSSLISITFRIPSGSKIKVARTIGLPG